MEQNLYRLVLESLPEGVCVVNPEGKVCLWTVGNERLTGYLHQDVLGHRCKEEFLKHVDTDDNPLFSTPAPLLETIREGRSLVSAASLRSKNGLFAPINLRTMPLRDDRNAMQGAVEIFTEVASQETSDQRQSKLAAAGCLLTY